MAYVRLRQGELSQAKEMFEFCIERFYKAGNSIGVIYAIEGMASMQTNQGNPERAAQLFAWTEVAREKINDNRPPIEQASVDKDLAVIHSQLDDTEFARISAEGRAMTVEQAIALAVEEINAS